MKVSLPEPQGARCPETIQGLDYRVLRPPLRRGDSRARPCARNRGTSDSGTDQPAVIPGGSGARPRHQVSGGSPADPRVGVTSVEEADVEEDWGASAYSASPSQVFLGAAAMGEPALGVGDQPPLLPRPPRSRGPSLRARSRPAESPSWAAGPPPPRRRPRLCL